MGKIASKIWSKGLLGGFGIPAMTKALEPLASWSRTDLIDAYQHFLDYCDETVDRHEFTDVFRCFGDTLSADAAFQALRPKKGRSDGNTLFAAAVATSNQSFISKVSLIFSIFDMNGDGTLNKEEFTVALRSLLSGLRLFYTDAVMPGDAELEVAIDQCFARIDCDRSGFLTLGEFIVYSYRNRDLQEMMQTVPTEDNRIFEDSVPFQRRVASHPRSGDAPSDELSVGKSPSIPEPVVKRFSLREEPIRKRMSLEVPDEPPVPMSARTARRRSTNTGAGRRPRPGTAESGTWCGSVAYAKLTGRKRSSSLRPARVWSMPPDVSKAQAWMLWKFFHHLSGHNSDADLDVVLDFLRDQIAVKKEFLRIASMAKSDEPYKEDERQLSKDAKEIDAEIKDATEGPETETSHLLEAARSSIAARPGSPSTPSGPSGPSGPSEPTPAHSAPLALSGTDFAAEVETLSTHFQRILLDPQVRHRLEWLQPCPMTLRAFLCLSFSTLNPTNIECIISWCNAFRALEVLKTLLGSDAVAVSESEIEVLFKFIDADGSGDLTMSELVLGGHLTRSQAEQLFEKCRRKNDAAISDKDLRNYIKGLAMAPGKDMKGVLETFAHSSKAHTPDNCTPEPMETQ